MKLEYESNVLISEITDFLGIQRTDVNAVNDDASAIRLVQRSNNLQQGCLSRSTRPYDTYYLTFLNM